MQHKPCTVLEPPENPSQHQDLCPADARFSIFSPTPQPSETSPLALPWYSTQVFSRDKGKASLGFYFNVKGVQSVYWLSLGWGLRFLLGEQQLGNSSVKVCGENHCEVILSMVRICPIHFPGHAWIFAVLWLAQEKLLSEQIQQNNLVAVRSVLSLDCISGHLLLTSLGIFTPLGSEEGLCMKYLLKKTHKC